MLQALLQHMVVQCVGDGTVGGAGGGVMKREGHMH